MVRSIDPIGSQWSPGEWIQAAHFDAFAAANFKDPKPYPRPGDAERAADLETQRRAALLAQRERMRARQQAEGAT